MWAQRPELPRVQELDPGFPGFILAVDTATVAACLQRTRDFQWAATLAFRATLGCPTSARSGHVTKEDLTSLASIRTPEVLLLEHESTSGKHFLDPAGFRTATSDVWFQGPGSQVVGFELALERVFWGVCFAFAIPAGLVVLDLRSRTGLRTLT